MASDLDEVRRFVKKAFGNRCINLSKDSLSYLTNYVKDSAKEARQKTIERIIDVVLKEDGASADFLNLDSLKEIIKRSVQGKSGNGDTFKLENVGEWKPLTFDKYSKKFCSVDRSVMAKMSSFEVLRRRFELVKELLNDEESGRFQSSIESLFSKNNADVRILGMLVRGATDGLVAEDLTGCVQLDLDPATVDFQSALYFEGGIFAFEGVHAAGRLKVRRVELPRLRTNAFTAGGVTERSTDPNDRLVFLSDVILDDPRVMKALYQILTGFSACPPNVFVLCGRFLRTQLAYGYTEASVTAFRHLANLLTEFAPHYANTHFVLVPCLEDPLPVNILPCFSLPPSITELFSEMTTNVHFASNPCRILFKGQSIVVCRDDLVEKLCRTSIHVADNAKDIPEQFCDTIWAQRHLSPLPLHLNPVLPQFDYLFGLWPAPDVLVLADKFKCFIKPESDLRRLTFNPGSFSLSNFEFQVFYPALGRVEASSLPPVD